MNASGCAKADAGDMSFEPPSEGGGDDAPGGSALPGVDGSNACRPGDVATYQPAAYRSATAAWQGVCTPELISGYYDACLGATASATSCTAFKADATAARCALCIVTPDTTNHYGPLIDHGEFISTNVAGCIELTDPSGLLCAKTLQAQGGCELAACRANCPVQDMASLAAFDQCSAQADQGGCLPYTQLSGCLNGEADAGLVGACLRGTFAAFYAAVVPLFCGTPQVDGAVPPFDASEEGPSGVVEDASVSDARPQGQADAAGQGDGGGRFGDGAPPDDGAGPGPGPGGHDGGGPFGMRDGSLD